MSFCRKCGAKLADEDNFCNKCGARVIANEENPVDYEIQNPFDSAPLNIITEGRVEMIAAIVTIRKAMEKRTTTGSNTTVAG